MSKTFTSNLLKGRQPREIPLFLQIRKISIERYQLSRDSAISFWWGTRYGVMFLTLSFLPPSWILLDELIIRLELTVKDFNEEMKTLVDQLVKKEKERQQILEMMKSDGNPNLSETESFDDNDSDIIDSELTEWEQKLAKIEKG